MDSKKEKLLKKTYDNYINLMLYDFPVEKISEIVANDVTGYGTTIEEKVLEIKRLKKIVTDQREQGVGIEMQFKRIPVHHRISPDEDTAIYMDEFEIAMVFDGNRNVISLRLSSIFEFNNNTWKLVHMHGSKAVETKEDTWHLNEWKQKSEQLQKLVDKKTAELLKQNRELEIEASLERVRSRSMAMQNSEGLLDVITVVSEQLIALGFRFSHVSFVNNNIDKTYKFWTSAKGITKPMRFVVPYTDITMFNNIKTAQKKSASFFTDIITQKEHKE